MKDKQHRKGLSRREFIKGAGATAAGVVAGSLIGRAANAAPASSDAIGANDRINIGIIGVGGMGGNHLRVLNGMAEEQNIKIVAVCDVWEKRREIAREALHLPHSWSYADYRKLLERSDIDEVVIATPDHWHGPISVDAMEAGKHVYVEKPMTRRFDEALDMLDTSKRTNRLVQVGSQACSLQKWHKAGQLVKAGAIGTVVWAQGGYCRNNPQGEWNYKIESGLTEQSCDWNAWLGSAPERPFSPERYFRWRKYWDYGTGIIGDLWPHRLHPLMIATGIEDYPKRVSCVGSILCNTDEGRGEPREVAEATLLQAEFPNGAMVFLAGSTVNELGPEHLIRGQKGNIFLEGSEIQIRPERPFSDEVELVDETIPEPDSDQKEHHRNFFSCIRNGGTPNCPVELGTRVMAIVAMAEESYRKNKMAQYDSAKRRIF